MIRVDPGSAVASVEAAREDIARGPVSSRDPGFAWLFAAPVRRPGSQEALHAVFLDGPWLHSRRVSCARHVECPGCQHTSLGGPFFDLGARGLILAHNHPSGSALPSEQESQQPRGSAVLRPVSTSADRSPDRDSSDRSSASAGRACCDRNLRVTNIRPALGGPWCWLAGSAIDGLRLKVRRDAWRNVNSFASSLAVADRVIAQAGNLPIKSGSTVRRSQAREARRCRGETDAAPTTGLAGHYPRRLDRADSACARHHAGDGRDAQAQHDEPASSETTADVVRIGIYAGIEGG